MIRNGGCLRSRSAHRAGFTLLELLVATGLLGLLTLALTGALQLSGRLWSGSERHARVSADLATVESTLRDLIQRAYPAVVRLDGSNYRLTFTGSAQSLELTGELPMSAVTGGYRRLLIAPVHRPDGNALGIAWAPERNQTDRLAELADGPEGRVDLLPAIDQLAISYYGRKGDANESAWHDEWSGQTRLPELVRIQIALPSVRARSDLYVRPRITMDAACVYDRLTRFCRGRSG